MLQVAGKLRTDDLLGAISALLCTKILGLNLSRDMLQVFEGRSA
jgi:hypothetical protein